MKLSVGNDLVPNVLKLQTTQSKMTRLIFSSVQSLSHIPLFETPWTAAHQASLSITNSQSLLKLMFIESVMTSNHHILCCPLLLLPPIFPSIRVFSCESALHISWPKYWSFSFSISPSYEYSRLSSVSMDWLDLLTVQGSLKSLLQHHSSKAAVIEYIGSVTFPTLKVFIAFLYTILLNNKVKKEKSNLLFFGLWRKQSENQDGKNCSATSSICSFDSLVDLSLWWF